MSQFSCTKAGSLSYRCVNYLLLLVLAFYFATLPSVTGLNANKDAAYSIKFHTEDAPNTTCSIKAVSFIQSDVSVGTVSLLVVTQKLFNNLTVSTGDGSVVKVDYENYCVYEAISESKRISHILMTQDKDTLNGITSIDGVMYSFSTKFINALWSSTTLYKYVPPKEGHCGHSDESAPHISELAQETASESSQYNINYDTSQSIDVYTEVYLVVDNRFYTKYNSLSSTVNKVLQSFAYAASVHRKLGNHLLLVGMTIWTDSQKANTSSDYLGTYDNFMLYRERNPPNIRHDTMHFLTNQLFSSGVVGLSWIGGLCMDQYGISFSSDSYNMVSDPAFALGWTIAHEIGHSLGFVHDSYTCDCSTATCIMAPSIPAVFTPAWSSCSSQTYHNTITNTFIKECVADLPRVVASGSTLCGNGIVEPGEQCDCGLNTLCSSHCCNSSTCMLVAGATCAIGKCCDQTTCVVKKNGTLCRDKFDDCDLPEYCNGNDENCPNDLHQSDGSKCSSYEGFCMQGKCGSLKYQCSKLYAEPVEPGNPSCFALNSAGNTSQGYCSYKSSFSSTAEDFVYNYTSCTVSNQVCGVLQCNPLSGQSWFELEESITYPDANSTCVRTQVSMTYAQTKDPGLVQDGTPCNTDKICNNSVCTAMSEFSFLNCSQCSNNGICNNKGECHCKPGYLPPYCQEKDNKTCGGSISGGVSTCLEYTPKPINICNYSSPYVPYPRGEITSADYPKKYLNNLNCSITLQSSTYGEIVAVTIQNLLLECCCDHLRIMSNDSVTFYDGCYQSTNYTIIAKSPLVILFTSDISVTYTGFDITYDFCGSNCTWVETMGLTTTPATTARPIVTNATNICNYSSPYVPYPSGEIISPNYPYNYLNNLNCAKTLQSSTYGEIVAVTIQYLSLECCCDHLRIMSNDNVTLYDGCYQSTNYTIIAKSPIVINFTSDVSVTYTGFDITYKFCGINCTWVETKTTGSATNGPATTNTTAATPSTTTTRTTTVRTVVMEASIQFYSTVPFSELVNKNSEGYYTTANKFKTAIRESWKQYSIVSIDVSFYSTSSRKKRATSNTAVLAVMAVSLDANDPATPTNENEKKLALLNLSNELQTSTDLNTVPGSFKSGTNAMLYAQQKHLYLVFLLGLTSAVAHLNLYI